MKSIWTAEQKKTAKGLADMGRNSLAEHVKELDRTQWQDLVSEINTEIRKKEDSVDDLARKISVFVSDKVKDEGFIECATALLFVAKLWEERIREDIAKDLKVSKADVSDALLDSLRYKEVMKVIEKDKQRGYASK